MSTRSGAPHATSSHGSDARCHTLRVAAATPTCATITTRRSQRQELPDFLEQSHGLDGLREILVAPVVDGFLAVPRPGEPGDDDDLDHVRLLVVLQRAHRFPAAG